MFQVVPTTEDGGAGRRNSILHLSAKNGYCSEFESFIGNDVVDLPNADGETALHLAAEFGCAEDVEMLLKVGASLRADNRGHTALHSAAGSSCCSSIIISLLLVTAAERGEKFRFLNRASDVDSGRNTALHVAAGNPNATAEFLGEFREADPRLRNAGMDTAFHVAAKSTNPDLIVSFLATFFGSGWDIDGVDANRGDKAPPLVNTCAGNGNAQAVALLMQRGADISQGALSEIVVQSVRKPEMIDSLVAVYRTVVDCAVSWRCAKENKRTPMRGSPEYSSALRETMIYLTTKPSADGKNVIQECIELGAADLIAEILNTDGVYRLVMGQIRKPLFDSNRDSRACIVRYNTRPCNREPKAI